MEPAKIDWKTLQSQWVFVEDQLYEHINAPKWFDFSAQQPQLQDKDQDVAWFCRPDCNHPTTAEDFLINPSPSKTSASKTLLLGESRKGLSPSPTPRANFVKRSQDTENQNPNLSTPVGNRQGGTKPLKTPFKSSSEKKKRAKKTAADAAIGELPRANDAPQPAPRLRSTLSARNLFAGRNILGHITDFVGELKRLALRSKEREDEEEEKDFLEAKTSNVEMKVVETESERERKPFLELSADKGSCRRFVRAENVPTSLNIGNNLRPKAEIRTSPPTPQCFSASTKRRHPLISKENRSRFMEHEILKDSEATGDDDTAGCSSDSDGREAKMLNMFWLLKPCTPSA